MTPRKEAVADQQRGRALTYRPLSALAADPMNPKSHDGPLIEASVGRFGYIEPIVEDGRTALLISGHGRVAALARMRERGESPPEGVHEEGGEWLVPVVSGWSSRSDSEARAALVALNRTGEQGGWLDEALLSILEELAETADGLAGVGFNERDITDLQNLLDNLPDPDLDDIADEWDGSGLAKLTIVLHDAAAVAAWKDHRKIHDDDDQAMLALVSSESEFASADDDDDNA